MTTISALLAAAALSVAAGLLALLQAAHRREARRAVFRRRLDELRGGMPERVRLHSFRGSRQ